MRIIRNGSGFELVRLSRADTTRLRQKLRRDNRWLMHCCIRDAVKLVPKCEEDAAELGVVQMAVALFNKLATAFYTTVAEAETELTHDVKNGQERVSSPAPGDRSYAKEEVV